jgi:hypothetical protein
VGCQFSDTGTILTELFISWNLGLGIGKEELGESLIRSAAKRSMGPGRTGIGGI